MSEDQLVLMFGDLTIVQAVMWCSSAAALLFALYKLWPIVVKFVETVNALSDLPAKLEKIDSIDTQVQDIHHETHFNSGTSIKDAMLRVENKVDELHAAMVAGDSALTDRVDELEGTLNAKN